MAMASKETICLGRTLIRGSICAWGAVMGLCGVAAGWGQREGTTAGREIRNMMLKWAAYTVLFGFFIGADNAAHAAGFVSGGVIGTPLQQILLHMPMRHAIANTLLVSTVVTAVASALVLWTGIDRGDFSLSQIIFVDFFMGGGAALAAPVGAHLGKRCNSTVLRLLFVLLTLGAGLSIVF